MSRTMKYKHTIFNNENNAEIDADDSFFSVLSVLAPTPQSHEIEMGIENVEDTAEGENGTSQLRITISDSIVRYYSEGSGATNLEPQQILEHFRLRLEKKIKAQLENSSHIKSIAASLITTPLAVITPISLASTAKKGDFVTALYCPPCVDGLKFVRFKSPCNVTYFSILVDLVKTDGNYMNNMAEAYKTEQQGNLDTLITHFSMIIKKTLGTCVKIAFFSERSRDDGMGTGNAEIYNIHPYVKHNEDYNQKCEEIIYETTSKSQTNINLSISVLVCKSNPITKYAMTHFSIIGDDPAQHGDAIQNIEQKIRSVLKT